MRKDMHKVIVERPRRGGHHAKKGRKSNDLENLPSREPTGRHRQFGYSAKEFSDYLSPLERYLESQLGRPWDKLYSEIAKQFPRTNVCNQHIHQHLWGYIEADCYIGEDQQIYSCRRMYSIRQSTPHPLWEGQFFVHPKTKLFCRIPKKSKDRWKRRENMDSATWKTLELRGKPGERRYGRALIKHMGTVWYECEILSPSYKDRHRDYILFNDVFKNRLVYEGDKQFNYYIVTSKRQLSSKEIKTHGLRDLL